MIDVYYNPILAKPWSVGLFSINYLSVLKLTQPDLWCNGILKLIQIGKKLENLPRFLIGNDRANVGKLEK